MKQEKFLSPADLDMAEAAPAKCTCGKYQRILKANTRFSWISTWGLLKEKLKRYGSEWFNYSQSYTAGNFGIPVSLAYYGVSEVT